MFWPASAMSLIGMLFAERICADRHRLQRRRRLLARAPDAYAYPPSVHIEVHPEGWSWKEGERRAWKEHEGRGYWHGGQWQVF